MSISSFYVCAKLIDFRKEFFLITPLCNSSGGRREHFTKASLKILTFLFKMVSKNTFLKSDCYHRRDA